MVLIRPELVGELQCFCFQGGQLGLQVAGAGVGPLGIIDRGTGDKAGNPKPTFLETLGIEDYNPGGGTNLVTIPPALPDEQQARRQIQAQDPRSSREERRFAKPRVPSPTGPRRTRRPYQI